MRSAKSAPATTLILAAILGAASLSAGPITITTTSFLTLAEGGSTNDATVGTFTDTDPTQPSSDFSATIGWGDGSFSSGAVSGFGGNFSLFGPHTYAEEGGYGISFSVFDVDGNSASDFSFAAVGDAPLFFISNVGTFGFTPGVLLSNIPLANFGDDNFFGTAADFSATIGWGDGSTSPGTVSGNSSNFSVTGSHIYAAAGSFPVTVNMLDIGGSNLSTQMTASSVPEPGTLGMMLAGLGLVGLRWRRVRSSQAKASASQAKTASQVGDLRHVGCKALIGNCGAGPRPAHRGACAT